LTIESTKKRHKKNIDYEKNELMKWKKWYL